MTSIRKRPGYSVYLERGCKLEPEGGLDGEGLGPKVLRRKEVRRYVQAAVALLQLHHVARRKMERELGNGDVVARLVAGAAARGRAGAAARATRRRARFSARRPGSFPGLKDKELRLTHN
jgi:hypothetical protein